MTVFIVWRTNEDPSKTETLGVYSTKAKAVKRCARYEDAIVACDVDVDFPDEPSEWPNIEYPICEKAQAAIRRALGAV